MEKCWIIFTTFFKYLIHKYHLYWVGKDNNPDEGSIFWGLTFKWFMISVLDVTNFVIGKNKFSKQIHADVIITNSKKHKP